MLAEFEQILRDGVALVQAGQKATARELLLEVAKNQPDDPRAWGWLSQVANDQDEERRFLEETLRCDPGNTWALARMAALEQHKAPKLTNDEPALGQTVRLLGGLIPRMDDAPLPTPDPWAADPPETYRCPFCALPSPGDQRCGRCQRELVEVDHPRFQKAQDATSAVLLFRALMLVFIAVLSWETPIWRQVLLGIAAGITVGAFGVRQWWRWAWWWTIGVLAFDALAPIQILLTGQRGIVSVPGMVLTIVLDLTALEVLFVLADKRRRESRRIEVPDSAHWPKTPLDALNLGVAYSREGKWYLAARMWQQAVAWRHHELQYRRALGLAYLHLRETASACAELQAAETIDPDDRQTQHLLALATNGQPLPALA